MHQSAGSLGSQMEGEAAGRGSSAGALQRGKACINCRRRKMRCDGAKPVCGPCTRTNRSEDCEYTDAQGRSRTQMLEENITRLEARIRELENPDDQISNISLHDPYVQSPHNSPPSESLYLAGYGDRPPSSASGSAASSTGSHSGQPTFLSHRGSPLSAIEPQDTWWTAQEPPLHIAQQLVDNFLLQRTQFGFFLNEALFKNSAFLQYPLGHPYRPSKALMSTVYLWGIHISRSDFYRNHESTFLSRALQHTANALSGNHPQKVLHALQSEILLAYYFFRNGRFLEGKYHSSAAASLAISCGLNKIRSASNSAPNPDLVGNQSFTLPIPRDTIEEGERINGFWTVFILDKCWSVALGSPSNLTDSETLGTRIDTPWPLNPRDYEQGLPSQDFVSTSTVQDFQNGLLDFRSSEFTKYATAVQASILFERATSLSSRCRPDLSQSEAAAIQADFRSLDTLIDKYQRYLIPMDQLQRNQPYETRCRLVAYTLGHVATIQLHSRFASRNTTSNQKCLAAASSVVRVLDTADLTGVLFLNPIMGTLWMMTCQVFIAEIMRLRTLRSTWAPGFPVRDEAPLIVSIESIMTTMAIFAENCPMINYQLAKVQEAYAAI